MNQILDYNPAGNESNNRGPKLSTDKIVRIFAILLIVFAVCIIGIGIINKTKNNSEQPNIPKESKAKIEIEDDSILKISSDTTLSKFVYSWNTKPEKTIAIDSGKTFEWEIDEIPTGSNTLNVQVIDINGNITPFSKEFTAESGTDIIDPTILECEQIGNGKLRITVTDETALDFITYRWNDEEEVKIEADPENPKKIVTEIQVRPDSNDLIISAVDKANNTASSQQKVTGVNQPKIQVVLSEDKSKLIVTCSHEKGISKIDYTLNDKPFSAELPDGPADVTFEQNLDIGYNKIIITVKSVENTTTTFGGECTYVPDQSGITVQ